MKTSSKSSQEFLADPTSVSFDCSEISVTYSVKSKKFVILLPIAFSSCSDSTKKYETNQKVEKSLKAVVEFLDRVREKVPKSKHQEQWIFSANEERKVLDFSPSQGKVDVKKICESVKNVFELIIRLLFKDENYSAGKILQNKDLVNLLKLEFFKEIGMKIDQKLLPVGKMNSKHASYRSKQDGGKRKEQLQNKSSNNQSKPIKEKESNYKSNTIKNVNSEDNHKMDVGQSYAPKRLEINDDRKDIEISFTINGEKIDKGKEKNVIEQMDKKCYIVRDRKGDNEEYFSLSKYHISRDGSIIEKKSKSLFGMFKSFVSKKKKTSQKIILLEQNNPNQNDKKGEVEIEIKFLSDAAYKEVKKIFEFCNIQTKIKKGNDKNNFNIKPRSGLSSINTNCASKEIKTAIFGEKNSFDVSNFFSIVPISTIMGMIKNLFKEMKNIEPKKENEIFKMIKQFEFQSQNDDLLFQAKIWKKRRVIFYKNKTVKKKFEEQMQKLNSTKKFYEKPMYFWSFNDVLEWSSYCFIFKNDGLFDEENYLIDLIKDKLKEKKEKEDDEEEEKIPFEHLKEILEETCDYEFESYVLDAEKNTFSQLVKLLLNKKLIEKLKELNPLMIELKELSTIENLKIAQASLDDFKIRIKEKGVIKEKIALEIFEQFLSEFILKPKGDGNNLCVKLETLHLKLIEVFKKKMENCVDIKKQTQQIFQQKENQGVFKVRVKLVCSTIGGTSRIPLTDSTLNQIGNIIGMSPPFSFFHIGLMLGGAKIDWFDNSLVHIGEGKASNSVAVFDVGDLLVNKKDLHKILGFIFKWNKDEKYHNLKNNCQKFTIQFIEMLFKEITTVDNGKVFLKTFLKGETNDWIKEMKNKSKIEIERRIFLKKNFFKDFPFAEPLKEFINNEGKYTIDTHSDVYKVLKLFDNQEKFNLLKEKYFQKVYLLKAFCRSFDLQNKNHNQNELIVDCFFNSSITTNKNKLGVNPEIL